MASVATYVDVAALIRVLGAPVSDLWLQALSAAYPWTQYRPDKGMPVHADGAGRYWIDPSAQPSGWVTRLAGVRAVQAPSLFPRMNERSVDLPDGHVFVPGIDNPNGLRALAAVLYRQATADSIDVREKLPAELRALLEDVLAVTLGPPSDPPHTV